MEMTRRQFGTRLLATAGAVLVWGCRRRGPPMVRRALPGGRSRFPGRVVPLNAEDVRRVARWMG